MRRVDRPGRQPLSEVAPNDRHPALTALNGERAPDVGVRSGELGRSQEEGAAAIETVQERLGNAWLVGALEAGAQDPFAAMVVGEMGMAAAGVQPMGGFVDAGNEAVQATMREGEGEVQAGPHVARVLAGTGARLPSGVLARMETAMGHEFGGVRVHTGADVDRAAAEIQARAFAVGRDLFFASGEFSPGSASGDAILAHELTHVIQHDEGLLDGKAGVSSPQDAEEREADASAAEAVGFLQSAEGSATAGLTGEGLTGEGLTGSATAETQAADASGAGFAARKAATKAPEPAPVNGAGKATTTAPATTPGPDASHTADATHAPDPGAAVHTLVAGAVAKAPKVVQSAKTALDGAEKKLHDHEGVVRAHLPGLLKARFKPMIDPLVPSTPGESVSIAALSAVIGSMVASLPEVTKQAGGDAEADQKKADAKPADAKTPDAKGPATKGPANKPAATTSPVAPQDAKHDQQHADPNAPAKDATDPTTQFFVTAIAEVIAALCPAPTPKKPEENGVIVLDPIVITGNAPGKTPAVKADTKETKEDAKAAADDKKHQKAHLQEEIESLKWDEERIGRTRDDLSAKVARTEQQITATREEMEGRRAFLEAQAKRAKKAKKKAPSPGKDARLRQLQAQADEMPKEVERLKSEMERVEKELAEATEKRQKDEELLRALEAELNAAAHGGGGAHIPPPTDEVATSKAVLTAIQPKKKKIDTDVDTTKKTWETLDKEVKDLTQKITDAEAELTTVSKSLTDARGEVNRLQVSIDARKSALASAPAPTDGTAAPKAADDPALKQLQAQQASAKKTQTEKKARFDELTKQVVEWKKQLPIKQAALEAAATKKHDAEKASTDYDLALKALADPLGCPQWQKIAATYKCDVKAVPLPPGMVRDENGALVKEADLKKKDEGPPKTQAEKDKEAADKKKKADDEAAADAKLTQKERDAKAAKKKQDDADKLLAQISVAKDKPKAERDAELARIAKEQNKSQAEIEALYKATVDAAAKTYKPGMKKDEALKAGMTQADFDLMTQNQARTELQAKAAATLGMKNGQDAVDQLWKNARERGLSGPGDMLKHLANADPSTLPKDLQEAAKRAHDAEAKRLAAMPAGSAERVQADKDAAEAAKAAAKAERVYTRNKELAAKLDCSPEEAGMYVKALAGTAGSSDDEAAEALLLKNPKATPGASPADLDKQLKAIHLLPPGAGRQKALMELAAKVGDPKLLLGASLVPDQSDSPLFQHPAGQKALVANPLLKSQLDGIDKLPPDQQWDAICNLARITGTPPNDLERARRNLAKKTDVVSNVTDIQSDESLTTKQKDEKIAEIAKTNKMDPADLKEFCRVERNKAGSTVIEAIKNDPDLQKQLDALNIDQKKTPDERALALKEIARRTGLDPTDLANWNKDYEFRQKKARWKQQFKTDNEDAAADKMAGLIEQYGSSDAAKDHLRNCPRDKLPPELQAMKDDLVQWDKDHPGQEVAAKLLRIDPKNPDYKKKEDALLDGLNSTYLSDKTAFKLLSAMSKEELAQFTKDHPNAFKDFFGHVNGDNKIGKDAANLFGNAAAYNGQLDKESADDKVKADKAATFEAKVQTDRDAAKALNMPLREARANLQAIADGNGMTTAQALVWLQSQPGKSPAEALKAAYAAVPDKDSKEKVNPVLRARLEQIDLMPPKERAEALKKLKESSGISDTAMDVALTSTRRDTNITADLHALRDLPKAERDAAMKDLCEKYHVKDPQELESIYKNALGRTAVRMQSCGLTDDDILPKGLSLSPEDMAKHIKELARKSGQSEESIRKLVEARRSDGFGADSAKMLGGEDKADAFKKQAADVNMTPSQYADWLARAPAGMLQPEQLALKKQLEAGGNKPVRSEAEKKEMEKVLGADPNDLAYRQKAARLTAQLQSGGEDAAILKDFGDMTPGQQKLFKEEWEKANAPEKLSASLIDNLQGGDEDRGLRMLAAADKFDKDKDAEAMFAAVDPNDKAFQARMDGLQQELAKGADADADKVGQMLLEMPLNQRAEFLRQYAEARRLAPQGISMSDAKEHQKYIPVDLGKLLGDNKEYLAALNQGTKLAGATTPVKDAEKTQRVQESITVGKAAAVALGVDQRTAFSMVDGLAKDSGLSPTNALHFLKGEPLVDESDKRSAFVRKMCDDVKQRSLAGKPAQLMQSILKKNGDPNDPQYKVDGQTLDKPKVDGAASFFMDGKDKSDAAIVAMIQGCNPRELAELDKQLHAHDPPLSLKDLTKGVTGGDRKELAPLLRGMEDYKTTESHYQLINTVKDQDPRKDADISTPEGFAAKLAWCKDLPPERRLAELNALRAGAGGQTPFGAKEVMSAWLNGPQGKGDPTHPASGTDPQMLSSGMQAQLDAIDRLPSQEAKDKALKNLAMLTGRWDGAAKSENDQLAATRAEFKQASDHTTAGMQVGKKMEDINALPEEQRAEAILKLSKDTNLSIEALHTLHDEALKAGLVQEGLKNVTPDVAKRIADIRALAPSEQGAAIAKLEADTGLNGRDINAHLQSDLDATKKSMEERNRAQQGADALHDKMVNGDTDGIRKQLEEASNDPAELQRILKAYGPTLEKDLHVLFGERRVAMASPLAYLVAGDYLGDKAANGDINYRLVSDMVQAGRQFQTAPELPSGVSPLVSDEVRRIRGMHLNPDDEQQQLETLRAKKGISEEDFVVVQENARVNQEQFDKAVERKIKLLSAEQRDEGFWGNFESVSDSHVKQVCAGITPEMMAEIQKRNPKLVENIHNGISGDIQEDFDYTVKLGQDIAKTPADERAKLVTDERVNHKAEQLQQEFDAWFEDKDRIKDLLKDCSQDELKALNDRFGGKLQDKIDKANETSIWGKIGLGIGLIGLAVLMGPLALAVGGVALMGMGSDEKDPEAMAIRMRLKDATSDPNKPYDPNTNKAARDAAMATLNSEFNSWWTRDSTCLAALKSLSPRDLAELQKEYNTLHGEGALEAQLRKGVSGDELVKSIACLRDAEDAAAGIDRGQQMKDTCRQMAVKSVMEDLKKDPKNKDKTESELYDLASKDESKISEKAKAQQKKISDGANAIFKAVDGWGDDEAAVQKTLAGLSIEEIALVKIEYRRHFNRDLDTHLTEDIGGKDLEVMQKLMNKETRVEGLQKYVLTMSGVDSENESYFTSYGGLGEDEEGIYAAFQAMSPEERTKVVSGPGGQKFLDRVKLNLGTNEAAVVDALTEINPDTGVADANPAHVGAAKMQLHINGSGDWDFWSGWGNQEKLVKEFDNLTPEQVQEASRWYEAKYGEPLAHALSDKLGTDSRAYAIVDAEMRGDKVEADVHRLKWAAQDENSSTNWLLAATGPVGMLVSGGLSAAGVKLPVLFSGTDEELLENTLKAGKEGRGGRDAAHLEAVKARFNQMFADNPDYNAKDGTGCTPIDHLIDNETSGVEKAYFTQLAAKGEADPEIELLYSMDGLGTDEERAKKVAQKIYDMSSDERAAFKHRFSTVAGDMYGSVQSLDEWIDGDFSGTEGFEMKLLLKGHPEKPEDYLEIARMRWEFERGAGNGFMNSFMDGLEGLGATSAGEVFANDTARIYSMFDEKGHLRPDVPQEKLEEVAGWQDQTAHNYRETRDQITDAVVNTLQVVGAVVIAVIPGCQGITAMIIANLLLAAATTGLKMAMKGNGYGWEDGLMDLATAAVTVATAGIGGKLGTMAHIAEEAGEVTGRIGAFAVKLAEKFGAEGAAKVVARMISESISNGIQGLLNSVLTSEDAYRKGDMSFFKHIVGGALGGALQGAASGGFHGAMTHTGFGKAMEEIRDGTSKAGFITRMGMRFADGLLVGTVQTATDINQWEAFGAGKGLDSNTLRGAFLQAFAHSLAGTAFEGAVTKNRIVGAQHEITTNTERMADIQAVLRNPETPPEQHAALQAEHQQLSERVAQQEQTIAKLQRDWDKHEALVKEQEEARAKVEQKVVDAPAPPIEHPGLGGNAPDPHIDAARVEAVRQALAQTAPDVAAAAALHMGTDPMVAPAPREATSPSHAVADVAPHAAIAVDQLAPSHASVIEREAASVQRGEAHAPAIEAPAAHEAHAAAVVGHETTSANAVSGEHSTSPEASQKPAERHFALADETTVRGVRTVDGTLPDGSKATARVLGEDVQLRFPEGMPTEKRVAFARESLEKLGVSPQSHEALAAKVAEGGQQVQVKQQLAAPTVEEAQAQGKRLYDAAKLEPNATGARKLIEESVHQRLNGNAEALEGKCSVSCENWQKEFAKQGKYVPVMDYAGHRWMAVEGPAGGHLILDPSFGQFFGGEPTRLSSGKNQFEPFIGTHEEMVAHVQEAIDKGLMPGVARGSDAAAVIQENWGIHAGSSGGSLAYEAGLKPYGGNGIAPPEGFEHPANRAGKTTAEPVETARAPSEIPSPQHDHGPEAPMSLAPEAGASGPEAAGPLGDLVRFAKRLVGVEAPEDTELRALKKRMAEPGFQMPEAPLAATGPTPRTPEQQMVAEVKALAMMEKAAAKFPTDEFVGRMASQNMVEQYGSFAAAHADVQAAGSPAAREMLGHYQASQALGIAHELQDSFPGLKVHVNPSTTEPHALVMTFEGARSDLARGWMEHVIAEKYGGDVEKAIGLKVSDGPVPVAPGANLHDPASVHVSGTLKDTIASAANGAPIVGASGSDLAYKTQYGFHGEVAADGAYEIKRRVVLQADPRAVADGKPLPDLVTARANALQAVQETFNDPGHRIVVAGVERTMRMVVDVQVLAPGAIPAPGDHVITVHEGAGRANSSNLYSGGQSASESAEKVRATTAHELGHAILGLGDTYKDDVRKVGSLSDHAAFQAEYAAHVDTVAGSAARSEGGLHNIPGASLMDGAEAHIAQRSRVVEAGDTWESIAQKNAHGISQWRAEAGIPVPPGGLTLPEAVRTLQQMNEHIGGDPSGKGRELVVRALSPGDDVHVPVEVPHPSGGLQEHQLKQIEWAIEQARRAEGASYAMGDGKAPDLLAAEAQKAAGGRQRFLFENPEMEHLAAAVADHAAGRMATEAESAAYHAELRDKAAAGPLGEHLQQPAPALGVGDTTGRTAREAQNAREAALGPEWKAGIEAAKAGMSQSPADAYAHEGQRNRLIELERISRLQHPAEARAAFAAVKANDEVAAIRPSQRANSADLAEAQRILAKDPSATIEPHQAAALLDSAVGNARIGQIADVGSVAGAHAPENLVGTAPSAQRRVAEALTAMGVPADHVVFHDAPADPSIGRQAHSFTVARMPDGQIYLIDPAFGQHLATGHDDVGRRLVAEPHGAAIATGLARDGYVRLDDATAAAYGKALTGTDLGASAADFTRPNGVSAPTHAETATGLIRVLATHEYEQLPEKTSGDPHALTKEALAMHHSEWAGNPEAQKALFESSASAVERMKSAGAEIVRGMDGAEVSSLRKRNNLGEFVSEIEKKQAAEGYDHVGKMCDIVRGRFNLATGADVETVVARIKEHFGDDVVKVKEPREGYPRWHINVRDAETGLVHEWQIGTKSTTSFFETKSLTIPDTITAFKGQPDFHDGVYKLLNKVTDPEIRGGHGIDDMLPQYKALAEATGKVTAEHPLPEGYADKYSTMTKAINEKLAAIERENPGYMNAVLTGEPAPVPATKAAVESRPVAAPDPVAKAPSSPVIAGPTTSPEALAHAVAAPVAAAVAPAPVAPTPSEPIGVRGYMAERDKSGQLRYGGAFHYDLVDIGGVSEARIKVHLDGGPSNPAVREALKAKFAAMSDHEVATAAWNEGNARGWGTDAGYAGVEQAKRQMTAGVERFYNAPGFDVPGPTGTTNKLRVVIEFVDNAADAHHTMKVKNGGAEQQANAGLVHSFTDEQTHAHEAGHAIFGFLDEYKDHQPEGGRISERPEGRRHAADSGISNDASLYGGDLSDPNLGLRDRHIDQVREQIEQGRKLASRGWTPEKLDELMNGAAQHGEWLPKRAPAEAWTPEQSEALGKSAADFGPEHAAALASRGWTPEQVNEARTMAAAGSTPEQIDAKIVRKDEWNDAATVNARRLRIAEKMTPDDVAAAHANGWTNADLQSGQIRQVAAKMSNDEFHAAKAAGWTTRQLANADAMTTFDTGQGKSRAEIKAEKAAKLAGPATGPTSAQVPPGTVPSAPAPEHSAPVTSHDALAMHHSEWAGSPEAQKALFAASSEAVGRMKIAGASIVEGMPGAEVSSLRKRDNFDSFVSEIVKKQRNEGYEHVGKMCDIVRGRFNLETGADVTTAVERIKAHFGDDVVKVKEPREGYPRWHINVRDAETGLVHEWQIGTKSTTSFFETKSLTIPDTITAFKGQPDFHDGVYKLLNKVTDPEIRARHGIDEMLPQYKALAEATGKVTAEHPLPEQYADRYHEMTKQINAKLAAIEAENPGYMNAVLKGEPTPVAPVKAAAETRAPAAPAKTLAAMPGGEVSAMNEFEGRVLVQYKNGGMQWMEKAEAAKLVAGPAVAERPPGVPVAAPGDKTMPGIVPQKAANAQVEVLGMHEMDGRVLLQHTNGSMQWVEKSEAANYRVKGAAGGGAAAQGGVAKTLPEPAPERPAREAQVAKQAVAQQPVAAPIAPGSQWAKQAQKVYANGSNTEFVHVDLQADPALRRQLDRAHAATAAGTTLDQKLALLAAHVKDGITYNMAGQQAEYQRTGGNVGLGQMIEQGTVVCREKALFTHAALAEMGIASKVVVGTVPDGNGATGGHAWVELADGTIIDGTWGRIFPAGQDPVNPRTRRNAQTFAEPRTEMPASQAVSASRGAAGILSTPQEMDRLQALGRRPAQLSPEDQLVRPGMLAWHPDGRTPVTVEYAERDKVQVLHDDGRREILDRRAFVGGNQWALQQGGAAAQGGAQAGRQGRGGHTQMMSAVQDPTVDLAGPDDEHLAKLDAKLRTRVHDDAVHARVDAKTRTAGDGKRFVDQTYDAVTVGGGSNAITNELGQRATGKAGDRLVIGQTDGTTETARADGGLGVLQQRVIAVEQRPKPGTSDADWHRPDATARVVVQDGRAEDGTPAIRYVYARRIDVNEAIGAQAVVSDAPTVHTLGGGEDAQRSTGKMLAKIPVLRPLVDPTPSDWGFPVVVGLQTPDGSVRVLGPAAKDPALRHKIASGSREFVEQSYSLQAASDEAGVGYADAQRKLEAMDTARLVDIAARPPEEQAKILGLHLGKWRAAQKRTGPVADDAQIGAK